MDPKLLQTVLPIVIIGVVLALRWRNLKKPRPLNAGRLWLAPAFIALVMGFFLFSFPPSLLGWAIMLGAACSSRDAYATGVDSATDSDPSETAPDISFDAGKLT